MMEAGRCQDQIPVVRRTYTSSDLAIGILQGEEIENGSFFMAEKDHYEIEEW